MEADKISPYINKITIQGYKSFQNEVSIDIKNLTILAGKNSSGKSSIFQPILLMKQTLEEGFDPGALYLGGSHVQFNKMDQLLTKISPTNTVDSFSIKLSFAEKRYVKIIFFKVENEGFEISFTEYKGKNARVKLDPKMYQEQILKENPIVKSHFKDIQNYYEFLKRESKSSRLKPSEPKLSIVRHKCFLELNFEPPQTYPDLPIGPRKDVENDILHIIHIPALRGNPRRVYPKTAIESRFPGTFEPYVASIIHGWYRSQNPKLNELNHFLKDLNLVSRVKTQPVADTTVEVVVPKLSADQSKKECIWLNIADVGFGISQTLPILVGLLIAKPGQIVYIEQPEIHLHPSAQVNFAKILVNAANRGVRVIIETHSDYLITGIQTCVAKDQIDPEKIIFHWFNQDECGVTHIESTSLLKDGSYEKEWPEDLSDTYLHAQSDFLNASEQINFKK